MIGHHSYILIVPSGSSTSSGGDGAWECCDGCDWRFDWPSSIDGLLGSLGRGELGDSGLVTLLDAGGHHHLLFPHSLHIESYFPHASVSALMAIFSLNLSGIPNPCVQWLGPVHCRSTRDVKSGSTWDVKSRLCTILVWRLVFIPVYRP